VEVHTVIGIWIFLLMLHIQRTHRRYIIIHQYPTIAAMQSPRMVGLVGRAQSLPFAPWMASASSAIIIIGLVAHWKSTKSICGGFPLTAIANPDISGVTTMITGRGWRTSSCAINIIGDCVVIPCLTTIVEWGR